MLPHVIDLISFLQAIDATPAHLVGNSWGAFVCLMTAIRSPQVVRTLVLEEPPVLPLFVSTAPQPTELLPLLIHRPKTALAILKFGAGTIAPAQRAFRRGDDEQAMRRFASGVLGKEAYRQLPAERAQHMRENLNSLRAQLLGAGFPALADDDVRGVAAPTLLMTGERSPAVLLRLTERLHEFAPELRTGGDRGSLAPDARGELTCRQRGDPPLSRPVRPHRRRRGLPARSAVAGRISRGGRRRCRAGPRPGCRRWLRRRERRCGPVCAGGARGGAGGSHCRDSPWPRRRGGR